MEILLATGTNQEFLQAAKTVGGKKVGTGGNFPRKGGKRKGKTKREGAGKSNGKGAGSKSGSGIAGGTEAFLGTLKGGGKGKGKGGGNGGRSGKKGKKGAWGIALRTLPIWNAAKFQLKARRAAAGLKKAMVQAGAARGQALSLERQWLAEGARAGAGADTRDMWTQVARDCVHQGPFLTPSPLTSPLHLPHPSRSFPSPPGLPPIPPRLPPIIPVFPPSPRLPPIRQLSLSQLSLDRAAEILETGDADASDAVFKLSGAATMADNCQGSFDNVRRTEDAAGGDGGGSGRYGMTAQVRETAAGLRDSIVVLQQQTLDLQQIATAAAAATDDAADGGDATQSAPPAPAPPGGGGNADGSTSSDAPSGSSNDVAPPPPSSTEEDVAVPASPSGNDQSASEGGPRGSTVDSSPANGQDGAAASDAPIASHRLPQAHSAPSPPPCALLHSRLMPNLVVAQDGSGDFTTIQDALLAAPKKPKGRFVILVMPGVYNERFEVGKPNITLVGLNPALTIITGNASVGTNYTTFNSATVAIEGDYFAAVNLRFENTAGKINNQAVALRVSADQCAFHNCEFWGFQDTLYTHSGRQYYRNCFITGNVDFIFGNAAAIFDNCTIQIRQHTSGAPVAASSRQTLTDPTGLVIMNSRVVGETTRCVTGFLGRPWKSYARAAVINSYLSPQVSSLGWMDWNGQVNDTISFIEFNNTGPGANGPRVPWLRPGILANVIAVGDFLPDKFLYPFGVIRALLPWL
ncbi:unnamed protein product [Closterium sp. Naga37s-1]|nr:unnamed protein product [Closterium sp. Naga37s-1]